MRIQKNKPHVNIGTIKSDITKTLENALEQIEKLEADKAELLEALDKVRISLLLLPDEFSEEIKSLIQKHKK